VQSYDIVPQSFCVTEKILCFCSSLIQKRRSFVNFCKKIWRLEIKAVILRKNHASRMLRARWKSENKKKRTMYNRAFGLLIEK
jgi:hypothetical protein